MSVSHVAPPVRFHHRQRSQTRIEISHHHRSQIIFGLVGAVLAAIMITAFAGLAATAGQGPGGYVHLSNMAIVWLWVCLMDLVAIITYLVAFAARA